MSELAPDSARGCVFTSAQLRPHAHATSPSLPHSLAHDAVLDPWVRAVHSEGAAPDGHKVSGAQLVVANLHLVHARRGGRVEHLQAEGAAKQHACLGAPSYSRAEQVTTPCSARMHA